MNINFGFQIYSFKLYLLVCFWVAFSSIFSPMVACADLVEEGVVSKNIFSGVSKERDFKIPADQIFKDREDFKYQMSNDGRYVASVKKFENKYLIVVTDVKTKKGVRMVNFGAFNPRRFEWKGHRLIVDVNWSIYEVTLDDSAPRMLLGMQDDPGYSHRGAMFWKLLSVVRDNEELIVVSGKDNRGRGHFTFYYNIYTGDIVRLHDIKRGPKGAVWHYGLRDGKLKAITANRDAELSFYLLDDGKPRLATRLEFDHPVPFIEASSTLLSRRAEYLESADENIIYISHNFDSDKYKIVKYDLNLDKEIELIFSSKKYDIKRNPTIYLDERGEVLGLIYTKDRYSSEWLDPKLRDLQSRIDKKFPDSSNQIYQYNDDFSVALFLNDDRGKGKDYIYEKESNTFTLFVDRSSAIKNYTWPKRKVVNIPARDGVLMEAYLTLPAGFKGGSVPIIVMPCGYTYGRYLDGTNRNTMYFASRGYGVLEVNHRGTYGFGMDYFVSGLKNSFKNTINDIVDAARWLESEKISEGNNIFLFGSGVGGNLALLSMIRNKDVFDAAVVVSAPINTPGEISDYKKYDMHEDLEYYRIALGGKLKRKDYKALSPYHRMSELAQPTLFVYGKDTSFVKEGKLNKVFKKSGKEEGYFKSIFIDGEGDRIKSNINAAYVAESTVKFFNKYVSSKD